VAAVRALAQIGDRRAGAPLAATLAVKGLDPLVQLETVRAVGALRPPGATEALLDLIANPSPAIRSAALESLNAADPQSFVMALSGLDPDRHWSVRVTVATLLGKGDRDVVTPRLLAMLKDSDVRVVPAVLRALVAVKAPNLAPILFQWITHDDVVIRGAAAEGIGAVKPAGGERVLIDAFHAAAKDTAYGARTAALDALMKYGTDAARPVLREALIDKDWAVRVHAASLLKPLEPSTDPFAAIRPAPTGRAASFYDAPALVAPAYSPHAFIDTDRGALLR
jgi:HEAT repeat protein